jgi:hypothetical protein
MINLIKVVFGRPQTQSESTQMYNFQNTQPNTQHMMSVNVSTMATTDNIAYQDGYVTAVNDATVSSNYVAMVNGFTPAPEFVTVFSSV